MRFTSDHPPAVLQWIFRQLLPYDPHELSISEIDFVYETIAADSGRTRANQWYIGQIFRSIPAAISNTIYWGILMLRHYATAALRNFKRNGLTTALNLIGLSVAVGAAIVMFLFIDLQINMDSFHDNLDDIYLVEYQETVGDATNEWGNSPLPLGPALVAVDPDVIHTTRMVQASAAVRFGDVVFDQRLRFADPEFVDVFSFPMRSGNASAFRDGTGVILSEDIATKFFSDADPIGQQLFLTLSNGKIVGVVVSGVAIKAPMASSFTYEILAPLKLMSNLGIDFTDWASFASATFVLTKEGSDVSSIESRLQQHIPIVRSANVDRDIQRFMLEPLKSVPSRSGALKSSPLSRVFPVAYVIFGLISLMVLLVACFNYVNIAIATAIGRSKEIGIRKAVGSYRIQLIIQFLGENILLSFGALLLGVALAEFLFIPWINSTQEGMTFALNYTENGLLWGFLIGVLAITGLGAGVYPAIFVSRFQPSRVLRGAITVSGKKRMTTAMLSTQLVFSFLLLAFASTMLQNARHQRAIDWGYDQSQRVVVSFTDALQLREFKHEIESNPDIIRAASTTQHIGRGVEPAVFSFDGEEFDAQQMGVGFDYLETMGVRMNQGRFFDADRGLDASTAVIVNRKFSERLDLGEGESAVGKTIRLDGRDVEIIGITENFYYSAFIFGFDPLIMHISDESDHRFLAVEVVAGRAESTGQTLAALWAKMTPQLPYSGFHQDTIFDGYFVGLDSSAQIFIFIGFIALVISIMGLFGLVLITVARRGREIGIRKTMGASVWSIIRVLQGETVRVILIALALGTPLSYFAIRALLTGISPDALGANGPFMMNALFLIAPAVVILASTLLISVAGSLRGATMNTVEILRQNAQ